jgi:hypothetical protein
MHTKPPSTLHKLHKLVLKWKYTKLVSIFQFLKEELEENGLAFKNTTIENLHAKEAFHAYSILQDKY